MPRYVALLQGINVGKHKRIAMADLKGLVEGLGYSGVRADTGNAEAQRWFDQGLMLTYGFNHDEAARSFARAAALDPSCALCFWGESMAHGPNINAPMDPAANAPALAALDKAKATAPAGTRNGTYPPVSRIVRRSPSTVKRSPPERKKGPVRASIV